MKTYPSLYVQNFCNLSAKNVWGPFFNRNRFHIIIPFFLQKILLRLLFSDLLRSCPPIDSDNGGSIVLIFSVDFAIRHGFKIFHFGHWFPSFPLFLNLVMVKITISMYLSFW